MHDMTAFERQVAGELVRRAGPVRTVHDAAIFNSITAFHSPKVTLHTMFSATKFVLAGAIVALFGGLLLSGVLTTQPEETRPAVGASTTPEATVSPLIELPTEIPAGVEWGTLETPLGQARWVHLSGDEATIPRRIRGLFNTSDGHMMLESDGTPAKLWRSRDLISWTWEPVDIDAEGGSPVRADGTYWLPAGDPPGFWRSPDMESWQRLDLDLERLGRPGPAAWAWSAELENPLVYDGVVIVPLWWSPDGARDVVARKLFGAERLREPELREVGPDVYELRASGLAPGQGTNVVNAKVRIEEAESGVRVVDDEDGAELMVLEGVGMEFIDRSFSGDIAGVPGLAILDGDALVDVKLPEYAELPGALWVDDAGFLLYALGADDGLVHVHRSKDGRDWNETDVIGDDPGEPTNVRFVYPGGGSATLETDSEAWTTTNDNEWTATSTDLTGISNRPIASGWVQGPWFHGDPPIGAAQEIGPGNVLTRMWFQPRGGEPIPFDITEMAIPASDCSWHLDSVSPNTLVNYLNPDCRGLREMWIITFDDVPA